MEMPVLLQTLSFHALSYLIMRNLDYVEFLSISRIVVFIGHIFLYAFTYYWISIFSRKYLFNYRVSPANKAVLITGCDRGFGHMLAKKLHLEGYNVFAACYFPAGEGAEKLEQLGTGIHVFGLDVTKPESVSRALEYVLQHLGSSELWAVVNNAGIFNVLEIEFADEENYRNMFDVNALGVVRVTKAFLPLLRKSQGRVVTVASIAGRLSMHFTSSYCMSKFATTAFCECLRQEMRPWGVKVVAIEPELYRTDMTSPDALLKVMEEAWEKTPEHIRLHYGENYMKKWQSAFKYLLGIASKYPSQVIDSMFDAVSLKEPDYCYKPRNDFLRRFAIFCLQYQPKIITDFEIGLFLRFAGRPFPVKASS